MNLVVLCLSRSLDLGLQALTGPFQWHSRAPSTWSPGSLRYRPRTHILNLLC
jgi:hypothetical protein